MKKLLIMGSIIASILLGGCASKNENKIETIKKEDISNFKNVVNPSEELQIKAVKSDYRNLQYIDNPSEKVKEIAIRNNVRSLKFINEPSEELKRLAIQLNSRALIYINPNEALILESIKLHRNTLYYIKNPSEHLILESIKLHPESIQYIKNPSEELQLLAVKQNGLLIKDLSKSSDNVKIEAVKQDYNALKYIFKPSDAIKLEASKQIKPFYSRYKIKDYKAEDKFIKIEVLDDSNYKIHNKTNQFININILSFYYGDKVQTISNIAIPPQAYNTLSFPYESVNLSKTKENFGFAVEYNINDKKHNLFKVNQYYLSDFLFNVF
ncbi:DUF4116 domain-containing protein [Aliarcobacter skirrowii]|uniref:DUF4116 domain-containing protein n=1 Tax=Aliarcobacter skirrowii TaxID=28200 RepID=UPI000824C4F8|nr:DUF4116 domain-containing protein [Aliarcobacter skirrowii]